MFVFSFIDDKDLLKVSWPEKPEDDYLKTKEGICYSKIASTDADRTSRLQSRNRSILCLILEQSQDRFINNERDFISFELG